MKKTTLATLITLVVLGAGIWIAVARPFPFMGSDPQVERLTRAFLEDLQYKDFRQAGLYHHKLERDRLDIGRSLEGLFLVKPELLDIRDYDIVRVERDEQGGRAKTLVRTRYTRLNLDKEPQEKDILVYWIKRHPDCPHNGSCPASTCVDEFGNPQTKKEGEDDRSAKTQATQGDDPNAKDTGELYSCDASKAAQWFMNLDSTLKGKNYQ